MEEKLVIRLSNNLGNQMFMYAAGFAASKKMNRSFYYDKISSYKMIYYKNNSDLKNLIIKLKENKSLGNQASKRSLSAIKNFKWEKVLKIFDKIF